MNNNFTELISKIKEINKFENFNPMQLMAIKEELENKNIIVASPTSSGKTLVAETYAINTVKNKRKRVLYLCPLKALASEHYNTFKKKYIEEYDIKISLSTGDLDSSSKYLENYHIVFLTYEKLDSLIRHKTTWLNTVGLIVVDEIHMIDSERGPTLESTIVQLKHTIPNLQVIGLSATIPNAEELAQWLNAEYIYSEYRPVVLKKGIYCENKIHFEDATIEQIDSDENEIEAIVEDTLKKQKQAIIFANTRKSAEAIARKMSHITKKYLSAQEQKHLEKIVEKLDIENHTDFDKTICDLISKGSAFHHAGIRSELREIIEDEFKNRKIKIITSTPTLAAGVNLPAYRVLITTLYRHTETGMKLIPVKEYLQMAGRAGRAGYDKEGEAILFAKNEDEISMLLERYVNADPEEINSQLGHIPTLRMIMLGLISNDVIYNDDSLISFFNKTFYAKKFRDLEELNYKIYKVLEEIIEFGFVKIESGKITATEIGKRVAELYIDPLSAYNIITKLKQLEGNVSSYAIMLMILTNTYELKPYFKPPAKAKESINEELQSIYEDLGLKYDEITEDWEITDKLFTQKILADWIDEISEQELIDKFNILPGILHNKIIIAQWIAYAIAEISKILDYKDAVKLANKLEKRLEFGIKEELLHLVELPNIGRVRARKLMMHRIRTVLDLRNTDPAILANILGPKVAGKLLDHLKIEHHLEIKENVQRGLFQY